MDGFEIILIAMSLIGVIASILSIIWVRLQRKRNDRIIRTIRRENEAMNYYLRTEIPNDIKERYISNINSFKYTNFDYENIESVFFELRKLRKDIQKSNDIRTHEIQEILNNNNNSNTEFDYKQLVCQISQMTNINYLFDMLNSNKNQEMEHVKNVLADIAHTIRNPASGISAIIAVLKMENIDGSIADKINDMEKLIDEIETNLSAYYQISHMESFVINNNQVELKNEIELRARLLALSSGKKINIGTTNLHEIAIDKNTCEILMLAITCILENSMSFISDNGVIDIGLQQDDALLNIEIFNNGPNIQEEFINSIFDQGFSTRGSSGRGLAIAKQAVENTLNGIISCENTTGGVKFNIIIEMREKNEQNTVD